VGRGKGSEKEKGSLRKEKRGKKKEEVPPPDLRPPISSNSCAGREKVKERL